MLLNYLITAVRSFTRYRLHFALNILGLGIGLAAAILIALYAVYESSYDAQQPHADRVWRIEIFINTLGQSAPVSSKDVLHRLGNLEGVEDRFVLDYGNSYGEFQVAENSFSIGGIWEASDNILDFISIEVLDGDLTTSLQTPGTIVLSRDTATKLFGHQDVVGKILQQGDVRWTVGAVFAELPENTHFAINGLTKLAEPAEQYQNSNSYQYLRLSEGTDVERLAKTIKQKSLELAYPGAPANLFDINLVPLRDIHLNGGERFELKPTGSRSAIYICVGLSILLVVLAGFNFVNMSIAQSARRAKEVGVRKTMGASRGQIMSQFLAESILTTLIAGLLACALVELTLPWFCDLVGRNLALQYWSIFGAGILLVVMLTGIIAGAYPAFFMAAFSANRVLSGDVQRGKTATLVRKTLLTLQSALSIALIIGAILLQQQLAFLQTLPVGYSHQGKLQVNGIRSNQVFYEQNKQLLPRLESIPGVNKAGLMDIDITSTYNSSITVSSENGVLNNQRMPFIGVGMNAVDTLGLELLAGRDFSNQTASDWYHKTQEGAVASVILTESLVTAAGFGSPEQALGQRLTMRFQPDQIFTFNVVGVVRDITVGSVKSEQAAPLFICGYTHAIESRIILDVDMQQLAAIRAGVTQVLGDTLNIHSPNIEVMSENYQAIYRTESQLVRMVAIFSGLTILLACFGIFGLASFSALRRKKEVSIRKVLGASRLSIVNLLALEFLYLVAISVALSFPLTYILVGDWLSNFSEHIAQSVWVYVGAALMIAGITWATVATIAFKVASAKPVENLRYE